MKADSSQLVPVATFVIIFVGFGNSDLLTIPRDTVAVVGQTAYFNCSTTNAQNPEIHWHYNEQHVYAGGKFLSPYDRFRIEIDNSTTSFNLVIPNVRRDDAGGYHCLDNEGFGDKRSAELVVLDENPVCDSDKTNDRIVGPNDCNIDPEDVRLSCSATYNGNIPPILKWRRLGDNSPISTDRTMCRNSTKGVVCDLTIKPDHLRLDGSSYVCYTELSMNINCTSEAINLIYSFNDFRVTERSINDELNCKVNSSEQCTNRWIWNAVDGSRTTFYDQSNVTAETSGIYRCESECKIRGKQCTVSAMLVYIPSENTTTANFDASMEDSESKISSRTASQIKLPTVVVATLICLVVLLVVCFISLLFCGIRLWKLKEKQRNKSNKSEYLLLPLPPTVNQEYEDPLKVQNELKMEIERLTKELETSTKDNEDLRKQHKDRESQWLKEKDELKSKYEDQLKVQSELKMEIERLTKELETANKVDYNDNHVLAKTINKNAAEEKGKEISGLAIADTKLFITSFHTNAIEVYNLLDLTWIRSWKVDRLSNPYDLGYCNINKCLYAMDSPNKIFRIDLNGKCLPKFWPTRMGYGCISVSYDRNVVMAAKYEGDKIVEYTAEGEIICEITLSSKAGFAHRQYAIKLAKDQFLISHGEKDDSFHRVCVVDGNGDILMSFGGHRGSTSDRLNTPIYMAIDCSRSIFVIDRENTRVLALSPSLKFRKEIILDKKEEMPRPRRMVIDEENGRLLVAHNYVGLPGRECRILDFIATFSIATIPQY